MIYDSCKGVSVRWRRWILASTIVGVGVPAASIAYNARAYSSEVRRQALSAGLTPDALKYPAHWPLDLYDSALSAAHAPLQAERTAVRADTVIYYLAPVAGRPADPTLVQEFRFKIGPRDNSVVVSYSPEGPHVDGSDAVPSRRFRVSRREALNWYGYGARDQR